MANVDGNGVIECNRLRWQIHLMNSPDEIEIGRRKSPQSGAFKAIRMRV